MKLPRVSSRSTHRAARLSLLAVVAVLVPLVQSCVPAAPRGQQQEPTTITVLALPFLTFAPYFIAEKEGYFAEEGLKLEYVKLTRSQDAFPALVKGEIDVASGIMTAGLINLLAREPGIKIVADKGYLQSSGCVELGIIARRELFEKGELSSPSQLKGRRLVTSTGSTTEYFVELTLQSSGLTREDVELVDIPEAAASEAIGQGSVDLVAAGEPWITRGLQHGNAVVWKAARDVIPDFQLAVLIYGPSLLERNPDAGQRFMNAYVRGVRQYQQGKTPRNLEILAEATQFERPLLEAMCWPAFRADGTINAQSLVDFQDWAQRKGLLDQTVAPEQVWQPRFVEQANRTLQAAHP